MKQLFGKHTQHSLIFKETLLRNRYSLVQSQSSRVLKSELGLRPIFHQKQSRVDAHLFITLLAYSIVHTIRYKLKAKGIHYSWETIRKILETTDRLTTSMKCKDGSTLYIRQSVELNDEQKEIYDALGLNYQIGEVSRSYISQRRCGTGKLVLAIF